MKKKVAIIGGGISGLACAYKLAQIGAFDVTIYEKGDHLGGRLFDIFAGRVIDDIFYPNTLWLTKELGLMSQLDIVGLDQLGIIVPERKIVPASKAKMYITKEFLFREKSLSTLFKNISVMRYVQSLKFNVAEHSSNVDPSLRSMSFSAWQKQYPEPIRRFILTAPQFFTFKELDKLSAETGLMILSVFYTTKAFYYFGRAPKAYAEAFLKAYKRFGVSVKLNAEIKSVEKISGSFHVTSAHGETEQADIVVSTLPLPISGEVINKTFSMDYTWDRGLLLKGKFKFPNMKISVSAASETNIRIIYNWGDHQILYLVDPGERTEKKYVVSGIEQQFPEVDFLYENKEWQLVHEFLTPYATPLQLGRTIPELDQGDGLYICGDFYSFPCLEAATSSAFKVADTITSKQ